MTPQVRVVRGAPDEVELAALVAGIAAGSAPDEDVAPGVHAVRAAVERRRWRDGAQRLTSPLAPGLDAWRWSARP